MVTNHVYTIAGAKGGVGKTTSSINLGTLLARAGYSTVVVEMDLAMANLVDFLDVGIDTDKHATFHDVLAGDASVTDAMYETDVNLSIVPSGTTLEGYADTDLDRLPGIVETLRWHHDIVLLDTPAGLSEETIQPLKLADDVLLVSTPRVASIRNVSNTKELAERVDAPVRGLILTKSGTGASPGADEIATFLNVELLGHVPEDDAVPHSQDSGTPVVRNAPNSGAAIAYERISEQLVDTEKASTDTTNAGALKESTDSDDLEPKARPTEQPPQSHSLGTTDGGKTVPPSDAIRDDSCLIGPAPAEQYREDEPAADDGAELSDLDNPAASETDTEDGAETTPVIDGTELVESEPAPMDGPEQDADEVERDGGVSRGADTPEEEPSDSPSDTPSERDADASDGDGLGSRMRSLFGF
ncbi:septum site-determining protein MinD [Haloarcula taiwanensis]|uniref:Septum site-determining protein MinD n=1 Tax=Haloarcula taiwanensis TaxID=1932004 RepID=A0A2H5A074_9EURY|nr:P-loop NTPase [Haloarcula taiwanensis]AUG48146.1 septum site-determining protein MinD [Haloarcula taiwanensis]